MREIHDYITVPLIVCINNTIPDWHQFGCPCDVKDTVLGFDLSKRAWIPDLPQLKYPRKNSACFYDGNHLVVAGGTGNKGGNSIRQILALVLA